MIAALLRTKNPPLKPKITSPIQYRESSNNRRDIVNANRAISPINIPINSVFFRPILSDSFPA